MSPIGDEPVGDTYMQHIWKGSAYRRGGTFDPPKVPKSVLGLPP